MNSGSPPNVIIRRGSAPAPSTPEALFADLTRPPDSPAKFLWSHQADLLREYHTKHLATPDIALELPTGAGKTLPALLIAEWRRRAMGDRVVYLCPTRQLAYQAAHHAYLYGVRVATLVGSHKDWNQGEFFEFQAGETIAVATYSTIFNTSPKIHQPQVLVLDDAHAGESYVADAWSIRIPREHALYDVMVETLAPVLEPVYTQLLRSLEPDPRAAQDVAVISPEYLHRRAKDLIEILNSVEGEHHWATSMIGGRLGACLGYVGYREILIRPFIAPTFSHPAFEEAQQRVYMSATLGESGELERAFGRTAIERLPVPVGWEQHGSGRRLFVFANRVQDASADDVAIAILGEAGKAVVISPDERSSAQAQQVLGDGLQIFGKTDIEASMKPFAAADSGLLMLTSRYDGIDLPDGACRLVILDELPGGIHLQERFLILSLGASGVLQERVRTRIVQGAGRCTRNPGDYAVVVVIGKTLTGFCGMAEVQAALHPELQGEFIFGWDNSKQPLADVLGIVKKFLAQDTDPWWKQEMEPHLAEQRSKLSRVLPEGADALRAAAPDEVAAIQAAWRGEWSRAMARASDVVTKVSGAQRRRQPYQALWNYLGSQWAAIASKEEERAELETVSAQLLEKAHAAASNSTWMHRGAHPMTTLTDGYSEALIQGAVATFAGTAVSSSGKFEKWCQQLRSQLDTTEATAFELGLEQLGVMLGYRSTRFNEAAAPDVGWEAPTGPWVAIEAKSDESPQGEVSVGTVRQANTHLEWMAAKLSKPVPVNSVCVIASPRDRADGTATTLASDFVCLASLEEIRELAGDAERAWREIRTAGIGLGGDQLLALVRERFLMRGVTGQKVLERLASRPISEGANLLVPF
jgi:hypothetical protein